MNIAFWIAVTAALIALVVWPLFHCMGGGTWGQWFVVPLWLAVVIATGSTAAFVICFGLHSLGIDVSVHHGRGR